jgi:hypothetical protein
MIITRRNILRSLLAAPAIVAVDRIMPVKLFRPLLGTDAAVTVVDGVVTSVTVTNGGAGYEVWPELTAITRRAWVPTAYVQTYKNRKMLEDVVKMSHVCPRLGN